jgi:hypothetical protein
MSLRLQTPIAPRSFFNVGELGLNLTFDVWVYVRDELAVKIRVIDAEGAIGVNLTDGLLTVNIHELFMTDA